jgi:hypothetical protein
MDKLERYREIVRCLIEEHARFPLSYGQIETEAVIDREHDHYEVVHVGWDRHRRVHGCVIHIDIKKDGKVWLQYDGTDRVIAEKMVEAGIPREDIVLGFQPPNVRQHTAFAVG